MEKVKLGYYVKKRYPSEQGFEVIKLLSSSLGNVMNDFSEEYRSGIGKIKIESKEREDYIEDIKVTADFPAEITEKPLRFILYKLDNESCDLLKEKNLFRGYDFIYGDQVIEGLGGVLVHGKGLENSKLEVFNKRINERLEKYI